jgi:hypothetical protein
MGVYLLQIGHDQKVSEGASRKYLPSGVARDWKRKDPKTRTASEKRIYTDQAADTRHPPRTHGIVEVNCTGRNRET